MYFPTGLRAILRTAGATALIVLSGCGGGGGTGRACAGATAAGTGHGPRETRCTSLAAAGNVYIL